MIYIVAIIVLIAVHMYAVYKREKKNLTSKGRMKMALSQSIYLFFVLFIMLLAFILKKTGLVSKIQSSVNGYVIYFGMIALIAVIFGFVLHKKNNYEKVLREAYGLGQDEIDKREEAKRRAKRKKELQRKKAEREAKAREREKEEMKRKAKEKRNAEAEAAKDPEGNDSAENEASSEENTSEDTDVNDVKSDNSKEE